MVDDFVTKYEFGRNFLWKYNGQESSLVIPDNVEIIGRDAFRNCEYINSIHIHKGVSEIRENAFAGCHNLESVVMQEEKVSGYWCQGVKLICDYAFDHCTSLLNVRFTNCLLKIGEGSFAGCEAMKEVRIPNIIVIAESAFNDCCSLKRVEISGFHGLVEEIGSYAFSSCRNLTTLVINVGQRGIDNIYRAAFADCPNLSSVIFHGHVSSISNNVFSGSNNITTVLFTDDVSIIGDEAFKGCENLVIKAPKSSYAIQYAKENDIRFEQI